MSYLFRTPLIVRPRQPFVDWVNRLDGPAPPADSLDKPTIYLWTDTFSQPTLADVVAEAWAAIFELELEAWDEGEEQWPAARTREMFDQWFDVELADAVIDLVPEDPLTNDDMDQAELDIALHTCAWCDRELGDAEGRLIGFMLKDRHHYAHRRGKTLAIGLDDERAVLGIVAPEDSEPARAGEDLVFKTCSRDCERALKSQVPKALRRLSPAK
jgi:hypothetical protein